MEQLKDKVILIGMPGCGKSTLGQALAKRLDYNFYDMDTCIEQRSGEKVPALFSKGEETFRNWESKVCHELCQKSRVVIASGGGVVERPENVQALQKAGVTIFIDRPIGEIMKDINMTTRPLLKAGVHKLLEQYFKRIHLYKKAAHILVTNDGDIEQVLNQIKEQLKGKIKE